MFFENYISVFIFLTSSIVLSSIVFGLSFVLSPKMDDREKLTAYECGFSPFEDSKGEFDVRFYLVAILFIIFDLEAAFLYPWAVSLSNITSVGFWSMFDFMFELCIGFVYVWKRGALEWE